MLTTLQADGNLKSRPMAVSELDESGNLWFFNNENSCKANEIKKHPEVNLAFSDSKKQSYISISGAAEISHEREKMDELMTPWVKAWFPEGLDDPTISLLKININKAAYWTNDKNKLVQAFEYARALATGERADIGKHETLKH